MIYQGNATVTLKDGTKVDRVNFVQFECNYIVCKRSIKNANKIVVSCIDKRMLSIYRDGGWKVLDSTVRKQGTVAVVTLDEGQTWWMDILGVIYKESEPSPTLNNLIVFDEVDSLNWYGSEDGCGHSAPNEHSNIPPVKKDNDKMNKCIMIQRKPESLCGNEWDEVRVNVSLDPHALVGPGWKVVGLTNKEPRYYSSHRVRKNEVFKIDFFGVHIDETQTFKEIEHRGVWFVDQINMKVTFKHWVASVGTPFDADDVIVLEKGWMFEGRVNPRPVSIAVEGHNSIAIYSAFPGRDSITVQMPEEFRKVELWECSVWTAQKLVDGRYVKYWTVCCQIEKKGQMFTIFARENGGGWCWKCFGKVKMKPFLGEYHTYNGTSLDLQTHTHTHQR